MDPKIEEIENLFDEVDLVWDEFNKKRKRLDLLFIKWVFDAIQDNFVKYPCLEHINININLDYDSDNTEQLSVSVNGYPYEKLAENEEIDNQFNIEEAMYCVVLDRLSQVDQETIIDKNTTLENFQKAMGRG